MCRRLLGRYYPQETLASGNTGSQTATARYWQIIFLGVVNGGNDDNIRGNGSSL